MREPSGSWPAAVAAALVLSSVGMVCAADKPSAATSAASESSTHEQATPVAERVEQKLKTAAAATKRGVGKAVDATEHGLDKAGKAIERTADKAGKAVGHTAENAKGAWNRRQGNGKQGRAVKKDESAKPAASN